MNNLQKTVAIISLMSSTVFLSACDDDDNNTVSSNIVSTGQMFATFQVISDGESHVYAEAQLTRNVPPSGATISGDFVRLVGDDELWLSAGPDIESIDIEGDLFSAFRDLENTHTIFETSLTQRASYDFLFLRVIINEVGDWYSARLPQSEDQEYRIALFRDDSYGADARDSVVTLPPRFGITSPLSSTPISRSSDELIVSWDSIDPESSVEVEVVTACPDNSIDSFSIEELVDDGSVTISAGDLDSILLSGNCSSTINVRKLRLGEIDPRFIGGVVSGYQIRRFTMTTID